MRLWSVHPQYFDRQALTAGWREALLAQAVLITPGRGYSNHPQLERFRAQPMPIDAISRFLTGIVDEADARGYHFAREKIVGAASGAAAGASIGAAAAAGAVAAVGPVTGGEADQLTVTSGQLLYEWAHLRAKLLRRSPEVAERWAELETPQPHPLFRVVDGPIASWERITA